MSRSRRNEYREQEYAIAWREGLVQSAKTAAIVESDGPRRGRLALRELPGVWAACGTFEWVALGYLGVSCVLILFFAENLVHPVRLIGMQALVAGVILVLCRVEARRGTERGVCSTLRFWRCWYPHLFFLFCFEELGRLVHLVQPGWQDAKLIAADTMTLSQGTGLRARAQYPALQGHRSHSGQALCLTAVLGAASSSRAAARRAVAQLR